MKLRSGKILDYARKVVKEKESSKVAEGELITEEMKDLIGKRLNELKANINNQITYDSIIKLILSIYTEKLSYNQVLEQIEKYIVNLTELERDETWGDIYSLTTLISGKNPVVGFACYDLLDEQNEYEQKLRLTGEIYNFIFDNS